MASLIRWHVYISLTEMVKVKQLGNPEMNSFTYQMIYGILGKADLLF